MQDSAQSFNPFAPGFDFLQKLAAGNTSNPSQGFGQWNEWVAPTMNVQDLEKRINELKTVLFWLEQNQRALAATIQAMEVQKMTLSALHTMNVPVDNWASTMVQSWQQFAQKTAAQAPDASAGRAAEAPRTNPGTAAAAPPSSPSSAPKDADKPEAPAQASPEESAATDPMQWWGALTQQFQHIARQAVEDVTQQSMAHAATTQQAAASAVQAVRDTAEEMAQTGKAAVQAASGLGAERATKSTRTSRPSSAAGAAKRASPRKEAAPRKAAPRKPAPQKVAPRKTGPVPRQR